MMQTAIDLLVHNIGQLATCAGGGRPKRGPALGDVGLLHDAAVAVDRGSIVAVGDSADLRDRYVPRQFLDAGGHVVCPGFVDPHTHVVYAGDRVAEFELKLQGATYLDILAAGGGIVNTMRLTREATEDELTATATARLQRMLHLGTTTVEIKSGYGLDTGSELKMLRVMARLDAALPLDIVPTFLGAHTFPPEFVDDSDSYVNLVAGDMMTAVSDWYAASSFADRAFPLFADVFIEDHAFTVAQAERILRAGLAHGLQPKLHVDQFHPLGGTTLAIALSAISVDHLDVTPPAEIAALAASDTVAVLLPAVPFHLGSSAFADGRAFVEAGAIVALATDHNPGSAPAYSMPLMMALATRYCHLSPAEALNAATLNAAHAIGLGDRLGSIEAGKQADLLLLDLPDYRHLAYELGGSRVTAVVKNGTVLDFKAYA